jgi:hypothetical protein
MRPGRDKLRAEGSDLEDLDAAEKKKRADLQHIPRLAA